MSAAQAAHRALADVEQQLAAVTVALKRNEPADLANATQQLRAVVVALSRSVESVLAAARSDGQLRERLEAARDLLVRQREQIARGLARADLAVQTVLPGMAADSPTYSRGAASRGPAARLYAAQG